MRARKGALALAVALLGVLPGARETAPQSPVCSDNPAANQRIACEASAGDIRIAARGVSISAAGEDVYAVHALHRGDGSVAVEVRGGALSTTGAQGYGVYANHDKPGGGEGGVAVTVTGGSIRTTGRAASAAHGRHSGRTGDVAIEARGAAISTSGSSAYGVYALRGFGGAGSARVRVSDASISTEGRGASAVVVSRHVGAGGVSALLTDAAVRTKEAYSRGVSASHHGDGRIAVDVRGGSLSTEGSVSYGAYATHLGEGGVAIDLRGAAASTAGYAAHGVFAHHTGESGDVSISLSEGASVRTSGEFGYALFARSAVGAGDVRFALDGATVATEGTNAYGVYANHRSDGGTGGVAVRITGGALSTLGDGASAVRAWHESASGDVSIALEGVSVTTAGLDAAGALALHEGSGSASVSMDAAARIEVPFHVGAEGRLTNDANASGRLLVTHAGEIKARDAGVLAWAQRASGHDFGEGAQTADDASRTAPMVHVVSSGNITVGRSVTDAFIRSRIAGDDGALSAGERAALSAIAGGDSEALETALAALPESYADGYRAEARELLRKSGGETTAPAALAHRAADGILGFARAGIRALALSHHAIADHVRQGGEDAALSTAERSVLAAALTGGDLDAALAALPDGYSDEYRNEARRLAASYSAGDVGVDVTGGAVVSGGDGVHAGYAIERERNGAVVVTVGPGARVEGGGRGVYVSGGGMGADGLRSQIVWVDGVVSGGAGAGVYMKGGGQFVVGPSGRVGSSSGVAFLSDGPGALDALVLGRVEGDIRGMGTGEHAVSVAPGAVVTGTIHLAASEVRVDGTVGAVRFDRGGTLALGPTGRIGGVMGVAARAAGDAPRLTFEVDLRGGQRVRDAIGDAWIINDGGGTNIFLNGVKLHDAERGATGLAAQVGAREVIVRQSETIRDRDFSADDFVEPFAPRAGLYESLPELLNRLTPPPGAGPGSGRRPGAGSEGERRAGAIRALPGEEGLFFPDALAWARLSGSRGRGLRGSTTGARLEFERFEAEAGAEIPLPWTRGLSAWAFIRHAESALTASTPGGRGESDLEGLGLGAGLSWRSEGGWYLGGGFSATDYLVDFSSKGMGALKSGVDAIVRTVEAEAGRRAAFRSAGFSFTPRVWLASSRMSVDSFTDAVGARFEFVRGDRIAGGAGVLAEARRPLAVGGGTLALRGSLDLGGTLSGARTTVEVSGERLHSDAEETRLLLGLGARWRAGRFSLEGDFSVGGLGSSAREYAGSLILGARF